MQENQYYQNEVGFFTRKMLHDGVLQLGLEQITTFGGVVYFIQKSRVKMLQG